MNKLIEYLVAPIAIRIGNPHLDMTAGLKELRIRIKCVLGKSGDELQPVRKWLDSYLCDYAPPHIEATKAIVEAEVRVAVLRSLFEDNSELLMSMNDSCARLINEVKALEEQRAHKIAECLDAEKMAESFHVYYERLAPDFGYKTRDESAMVWADVPEKNKLLMIAVCERVLGDLRSIIVKQKMEREADAQS